MSEEPTTIERLDDQFEEHANRTPNRAALIMAIVMISFMGTFWFAPIALPMAFGLLCFFVFPIIHTLCRKVQSLTMRITELELALQQNNSAQ